MPERILGHIATSAEAGLGNGFTVLNPDFNAESSTMGRVQDAPM